MRSLAGFAIAVALSACASAGPEPQVAMLQHSVYVAGDHNAPVQPMEIPPATTDEGSRASALKRLYWFFAGR
jgi:hypothetical protein